MGICSDEVTLAQLSHEESSIKARSDLAGDGREPPQLGRMQLGLVSERQEERGGIVTYFSGRSFAAVIPDG